MEANNGPLRLHGMKITKGKKHGLLRGGCGEENNGPNWEGGTNKDYQPVRGV